MRIAVIGATGTAGSRTVAKLRDHDLSPRDISRSQGVDLITGDGLHEALEGIDVAIDTSTAFPPDGSVGPYEALTGATRNLLDAAAAQGVGRLVFLSIAGTRRGRSGTGWDPDQDDHGSRGDPPARADQKISEPAR